MARTVTPATQVELLRRTKVVPHLSQPSAGALDGTYMLQSNRGYLFAFNPSATPLPLVVPFNSSIGFDCGGTPVIVRVVGSSARGATPYSLGVYECGSSLTLDVPPTTAIVLQFVSERLRSGYTAVT